VDLVRDLDDDGVDLGEAVPGLGRFLFTAQEVAQSLAISTTLVRQLTLTGAIPCRRIGRLVRYSPQDVRAFVDGLDQRGYQRPRR
jgi:excisionase family DNA binding protein